MSVSASKRPLSVTLAALLLGGITFWRFAVVPSVRAIQDGEWMALMDELFVLAFWGAVIWGLLALQRWAWWCGVVFGGLIGLFWFAVLLYFDSLRQYFPDSVDPSALRSIGQIVAFVAALAWVLLILPISRRAFRD
jgi:hypothetical protein